MSCWLTFTLKLPQQLTIRLLGVGHDEETRNNRPDYSIFLPNVFRPMQSTLPFTTTLLLPDTVWYRKSQPSFSISYRYRPIFLRIKSPSIPYVTAFQLQKLTKTSSYKTENLPQHYRNHHVICEGTKLQSNQ